MLPSRKLGTDNHLWSPRWTQCHRPWSCTPIAWQGEVAISRINRTLPDVPTGAPHIRSFPENLPATEAQGKAGTWISPTGGSWGGAGGSGEAVTAQRGGQKHPRCPWGWPLPSPTAKAQHQSPEQGIGSSGVSSDHAPRPEAQATHCGATPWGLGPQEGEKSIARQKWGWNTKEDGPSHSEHPFAPIKWPWLDMTELHQDGFKRLVHSSKESPAEPQWGRFYWKTRNNLMPTPQELRLLNQNISFKKPAVAISDTVKSPHTQVCRPFTEPQGVCKLRIAC